MSPIAPILIVLASVAALSAMARGLRPDERRVMRAGLLAQLASAIALVVYHEYFFEGGDIRFYEFHGAQIAELLDRDFFHYIPDVLRVIAHADNNLPVKVFLEGSTTGTMSGLAGLVFFLTGPSLYAGCLLASLSGFVGHAALYRATRPALTEEEQRAALPAFFFVPTALFWSGGIVKEAFVVGFLGLFIEGVAAAFRRKSPIALALAVLGGVGTSLVKPYAMFPTVLAIGAWVYASRGAGSRLSWPAKLGAFVVAVGGLVAMSRIFPEYGVDRLGESIAHQQWAGTTVVGGGSQIEMGDAQGRGLGAQLRFVPLAMINSFGRPFFFDIRNFSTLFASIEMTAILVLLVGLVRRAGWRRLSTAVQESAPLLFAFVFVVAFGVAVGLTTTNLGTLSRYRMPMMPIYVAALLVLRQRFRQRAVVPAAPRVVRRSARPVAAVRPRGA